MIFFTNLLLDFIWKIMKPFFYTLTIIIIFTSSILANDIWAQSAKDIVVSVNYKQVSLKDALVDLEKKSHLNFIYSHNLIETYNGLSLKADKISLAEALNRLTASTRLMYIERDNKILIVNRPLKVPAPVQVTSSIIGKIYDEAGIALPGVIIRLEGPSVKTISSNTDGTYILDKLPLGTYTLKFSFIGFSEVIRTVNLTRAVATTLNITLIEEPNALNEVVVVGYGDQKKRDVTGAIGSINAKSIENMPVVGLDQALTGQIAGVQVQQTSGEPGGNINVVIRGNGSIGAGNEPLYVVDGFPGITDLASINPNDIESIDVLKDASAAAIYGSRGANGVVIVTTKRGKAGQTKFNVNTYTGLQEVINRVEVLNATEYAQHSILARNNAFGEIGGVTDLTKLKNSQRPGAFQIFPEFLENDSSNNVNPSLGAGTDWQDEIFRLAPARNFQITATGGNEKIKYAIAGAYFEQAGVIIESGFRRFSTRINLDAELTSKLKIGVNLAPSYTSRDIVNSNDTWSRQGIILSALAISPSLPVFESDGTYSGQYGLGYGINSLQSPVAISKLYKRDGSGFVNTGNIFLDYKIIKGLSLRSSVGVNINSSATNEFYPSTLGRDGARPPSIAFGISSTGFRTGWVNSNTLTYIKTFSKKHNLTALIGNEIQKDVNRTNSLNGTNFPTDAAQYIDAAGIVTNGRAGISESALESYFSRVTYNYDRKYLLTLNMRTDGSSRFGPNNRFGTFPSASIGWVISDEPFLKNITFLDELKFRASLGVGGNNNIGNYAFRGLLGDDNYVFGSGLGTQTTGLAPTNLSNPDLRWEKSRQLDFGVDIGLFANRVFLVADYYTKETKDLLLNVNTPRLTGYTSVIQNIGRIRNSGFEFAVNTKNFVKAFQWNSNFNIAFNSNKVLALGPEGDPIRRGTSQIPDSHITEVGKPLGNFFGYIVDGVFNTQAEIDASPVWATGNKTLPGDYKFRDTNGDQVINAFDRTVIGNAFPDFIYGLTNTFNFKNMDLSILVQGSKGNQVINGTRRFLATMGVGTNQLAIVRDSWKSPENPGNGLARPHSGRAGNNNNANMNSTWLEDGSYLSIRNISLGYRLPQKVVKSISLQNVRLYGTVQNAFMFTKYLGYNPDVSFNGSAVLNPGVDYGSYPIARTITFGVNMGF